MATCGVNFTWAHLEVAVFPNFSGGKIVIFGLSGWILNECFGGDTYDDNDFMMFEQRYEYFFFRH